MPQTQVQIRMDKELKEKAEVLFAEMGMNISTAVNIYFRQVIRDGKIPFEISLRNDGFYSDFNQSRLRDSISQLKSGNVVVKTMAELEAMEK